MLEKTKSNILKRSGSYQHLEKENEQLKSDLDKKINRLSKRVKELEKNSDSYNQLFNRLFQDYELKPKGALQYTFTASLKLLDFVANLCRKYEVEYWLDYGTLLGAVRHRDYIPWDDDIDIAMMREEYDKLYAVLENEFKQHNLDDIIVITRDKITRKDFVISFIQISIQDDEGRIYTSVDIFPYDYITDINQENEDAYPDFYKNFFKGVEYEDNIRDYYDSLKLSYEMQDHIIRGYEHMRKRKTFHPANIFNTSDVFPLKEMQFNDRKYPCPNNPEPYLTDYYGDIWSVPKNVFFHQRLIELRKYENLEERYAEFIEKLDAANAMF